MSTGIYIRMKSGDCIYIPFDKLGEWKSFSSTHFIEEINEIEIKSLSLNNSQPINYIFWDKELEGLEFTKILTSQMGFSDSTSTAAYIPAKGTNYRMVINENNRLIFEGNDGNPDRTKVYALKRRP